MRRASGRFAPAMPRYPRRTLPSRRSCTTTHFTVSIAVAKQIPCAPGMIAVFYADYFAARVHEGAAGIPRIERGIRLQHVVDQTPSLGAQLRPSALTTPAVTVCWKPYGLPIAIELSNAKAAR